MSSLCELFLSSYVMKVHSTLPSVGFKVLDVIEYLLMDDTALLNLISITFTGVDVLMSSPLKPGD